jgi:carboxypeptidase Taq
MPTDIDIYSSLVSSLKEISLLSSVGSIVNWDERTQMPPKGAAHRADQASLIARLTHEQFTSPAIGQKLAALEASDAARDPGSDAGVVARETRRAYDRAVKLPAELVEEMTKTEVLAQQAWGRARAAADYSAFEPWLAKILDLKRRQSQCLVGAVSYDALLDDFEPGETAENLRRVFSSLRGPLVDLVGRIASSGRKAPAEILRRKFPSRAQETLAREAAAAVGFDFAAGRLDVSLHPFCTEIGPGDTRMTTRYDEHGFADAFFGVLHETGHALYNQGLPAIHWGTPLGQYVSLGIHESQSRLWENLVGRSRAFWTGFLPRAKEIFPESLADVTLDQWHFAINAVRPSFIRTESDEATYNLHILLRFELEEALLTGDLSTRDLPAAWGEKMRTYLGITPPDDAKGCLQDIHWSGGAIGYFPTYTLGNLYSAQFFQQARQDLGDLDAMFAGGEFQPLLQWLRSNIHAHGRRFTAGQLVQRITGRPLSAQPLLDHLNQKGKELYGV